jgi:transcriptional regulator with GAF, ATPase, and Fis domain
VNSSKQNQPGDASNRVDELQARLKDYERLNEVFAAISSSLEVEEILKQVIEKSLQLCDADQASILLIGSIDRREVKTIIREGYSDDAKLDHYLNNLIAGWVSQYKKPLLTNDLAEIFGQKNIKGKYRDIISALGIPILGNEKTIGVINLISEKKDRKFGDRELQLMNILASHCTHLIQNANLHEQLFKETQRLKKAVQDKFAVHGIIGHSEEMQTVFSLIQRVAETDIRVLLEGESGTGKERIARAIHYDGLRKDSSFVAVDCGSIAANLLESELFGYVKGAFTGASQDRTGLFEEANGGTLFLDEIGNMPSEIQPKFLRAIQEGEIRPVGSTKVRKIDVRIIAACSINLEKKVKDGSFRQDLYFRLNVVKIPLPPLRERKEDIAILADHFFRSMNERYGKKIKGFNPGLVQRLERYSWPGNVRELEHAIERAVVLCESTQLAERDFPFLESPPPFIAEELFQPRALQEALNLFKKQYINKLLEHTGGNQSEAAKILNIQRTYLNRLIKELKIMFPPS